MNEIKNYIPLKGGLTCKMVNPFSPTRHPLAYDMVEKTNPTLPIATSTPMIDGVVFFGRKVWQAWDGKGPMIVNQWFNCRFDHTDYERNGIATRLAVEPIREQADCKIMAIAFIKEYAKTQNYIDFTDLINKIEKS